MRIVRAGAPALFALLAAAAPAALMPLPAKLVPGQGALPVDASFRAASEFPDQRLQAAIARFHDRLARQTGLPLVPSHTQLSIKCAAPAPAYPTLNEDESYSLDISPQAALLEAPTVTGVFRGLETFLQLVSREGNSYTVPVTHIEDRPRYPWRGLMLDVSRHWMPVPVIERNLDAMAAVKLNVLHWHLADDQGFRVESLRFPLLQKLGSDGNYYTQEQVRHVVAYARDRGIRVIPEFDIPGHTSSWFAAYPNLASAPGPFSIERKWGIFQPTMDPASPATYTFLEAFLDEMTALFPDPFFHIGGDEVDPAEWNSNPSIQAFAREHQLAGPTALHAQFNRRVQAILKKHGKTLVGWDEIFDPSLDRSAVIQSWRGADSLSAAAAQGFRGILSYGYYLDHLRPASYHYAIDPGNALGGEACMWTEYVNAESVDSRLWPRLAAIAERFWSPRETTDTASMYRRLASVSAQLTWTGVTHRTALLPALDRLAPSGSLQVLADASEATGIGVRRTARSYTSLIPLNRFVDAVPPESEFIRALQSADEFALRVVFQVWSAYPPPAIPELIPLAKNLASAGAIGLAALDHPDGAAAGALARKLDALDHPVAEVNLAAIRIVRQILKTGPLNHSNGGRSIR